MNKEEAIKMLRSVGHPARLIHIKVEDAKEIADLLDAPKHPDPGTFVEWRPKGKPADADYVPALALPSGVRSLSGNIVLWNEIEYRRVYTVTPPPLKAWNKWVNVWAVYEHHCAMFTEEPPTFDPRWGRRLAMITREQMERQNGIADDGEMG